MARNTLKNEELEFYLLNISDGVKDSIITNFIFGTEEDNKIIVDSIKEFYKMYRWAK